jgi:hypothetical protein
MTQVDEYFLSTSAPQRLQLFSGEVIFEQRRRGRRDSFAQQNQEYE